MDIGEAEVPAAVAVGEFFVIKAEQMEHGGVEVVDVDFVFNCLKTEIIGRAVDLAAFDSAACHPNGKAVVIVVATVDFSLIGPGFRHFDHGSAAEFSAPKHEGFIEHSAHF